jgi:hypothetical protein
MTINVGPEHNFTLCHWVKSYNYFRCPYWLWRIAIRN